MATTLKYNFAIVSLIFRKSFNDLFNRTILKLLHIWVNINYEDIFSIILVV